MDRLLATEAWKQSFVTIGDKFEMISSLDAVNDRFMVLMSNPTLTLNSGALDLSVDTHD